METRIIEPSVVFPCDLPFLKDQLRITHTAHDAYLTSLIAAATEQAYQCTGRQPNYATILQSEPGELLKNGYNMGPKRIFTIQRGPVIAVTKIEYLDASAAVILIDSSNYSVEKGEYDAMIYLEDSFNFTDLNTDRPDAIRITFTAGFGGTAAGNRPFPEMLRNAVSMIAARLYTNPTDGIDEKASVSDNLLKFLKCPIV